MGSSIGSNGPLNLNKYLPIPRSFPLFTILIESDDEDVVSSNGRRIVSPIRFLNLDDVFSQASQSLNNGVDDVFNYIYMVSYEDNTGNDELLLNVPPNVIVVTSSDDEDEASENESTNVEDDRSEKSMLRIWPIL